MQNLYLRVVARSLILLAFIVGLHYCLRVMSLPSDLSILGLPALVVLVMAAFKLTVSTFVEKEKEDGVRNEQQRGVADKVDPGGSGGSGSGGNPPDLSGV